MTKGEKNVSDQTPTPAHGETTARSHDHTITRSHNRTKSRSDLRKFGLTIGIALAVFGGIALWRGAGVTPYLLGGAAVMLLLALVVPAVLRPLEYVWMKLALVLSYVMTRVILTLAFYLAITPMAFLLRLLGKDLLSLKLDPQQQSYWVRVEADESKSRHDRPY